MTDDHRNPVRGTLARVADAPAGAILAVVRRAYPHKRVLSAAALVVVLLFGVLYLMFGSLGIDPTAETITVRVHLADSGGLLAGQNVTLRGVPVGKVTAVDLSGAGVTAVATIDADARIPADGPVTVSSLSLAGEQYLDFRPTRDGGPYLADNADIDIGRTSTPTPLWKTLSQLDSTLTQVDPAKLAAVTKELGVSPAGPQKLADILDGGIFLINTLDSVLPQTVSLLRDSKTVLATLSDGSAGIADIAHNADTTLRGVNAKTGGFVDLLGAAPGTLRALDAVLADNAEGLVGMTDSLGVVAQMTNSRVPALQEFFFPAQRGGSTLGAISVAFHDGGISALVNLFPRYSCDYGLPRQPPSLPTSPEPYLYAFCPDNDPSVLIRGARNAPRPADDPAPTGPPPGVAADTRSSPTPQGPQSLPIPFGGPDLSRGPR